MKLRPSVMIRAVATATLIAAARAQETATVDPSYDGFLQAELAALPGTPTVTIRIDDLAALGRPGDTDDGNSAIVDVAGQPFAKAVQIRVKRPVQPVWTVQLTTPNNLEPIRKGDVLLLVCHVRCPESKAESGGGNARGYLQLSRDPWTGTGSFGITPGRDWTKRYFRTVAEHDYDADSLQLTFHLGQYEQLLEFGGIALLNFGPDVDKTKLPVSTITYPGREADAPWRKEAAERIEKYRKGNLEVVVTNADGDPVPGAQVRVQMLRHAYEFGTFLEGPTLWDNADGERYRETVRKLFNRVTCPTYWADWGWANPEGRARYLALAEWAAENDFAIRGHNLIWPSWRWTPSDLRKLENDPEALGNAIRDSITERVTLFKRFGFKDYDVINELRDNHEIVDILGKPVIVEWHKLAKQLDPTARMGTNDYSILTGGGHTERQQEIYEEQIRYLRDNGAPMELIGFQCHMGEDLTPPDRVVKILDRFAAFGLPLHATEFDISTDDEAAQGDYLRDFLTAFFSHPATEAFVQWGFWEGQHWIPRAALFRKDWSPKPNGRAYMDLVLKEWWTEETVTTDEKGECTVRGFLGDYRITVAAGGAETTETVTLERDGTTVPVTF